MSDERYARLVRTGLAPLVEEVPEGPQWHDIVAADVTASPPRLRHRLGWVVGLATACLVTLLFGLVVVFTSPEEGPTPGPTGTVGAASREFDSASAARQLSTWWDLVIAGNTAEAVGMAHPDAEFNFPGLYESLSSVGDVSRISIGDEVFGSTDQPLVCYYIEGNTGRESGAGVFRQSKGAWLVWEIRPQTSGCLEEATSTTSTSPVTTRVNRPPPLVSSLATNPGVPLKIVAIRPNNPSIAVIDLETGTLTEYPPGFHALPADATDGAVMTSTRDLLVWTNGVAWLFENDLSYEDSVIEPIPRELDGIAPALRVVPLADGTRAWVVQPGHVSGVAVNATYLELVDIQNGDQFPFRELDPNAFPVASAGDALILNTYDTTSFGEEDVLSPVNKRVLRLDTGGALTEIGPGEAIAATGDSVVVIGCLLDDVECDAKLGNDLFLVDEQSGERLLVIKPLAEGVWLPVGGPMIPSGAMPLQTVSPDDSTLLVSLGLSLDVNGKPLESSLVAINLNDGTTQTIASFSGRTPLATWSADGDWVALFERVDTDRIDIELIRVSDPSQRILIEDAFPSGHFPLAAG